MTLHDKIIRYIYTISFTFLTLSGFAQMPIFKRYRIADIPGLGWLAEFYITHSIHYIFASVLIALFFYIVVGHIINKKKEYKLTSTGYVKLAMLAGLIITGGFMVFKNLSGTPYPPFMISLLDLSHLALCMALLIFSLITGVIKKGGQVKII